MNNRKYAPAQAGVRRSNPYRLSSIRIIDISLLILAGLAMACSGQTSPGAGSRGAEITSTPTPQVQHPSTGFDGERALSHVKAQVELGPRPAGSAALEKAQLHNERADQLWAQANSR